MDYETWVKKFCNHRTQWFRGKPTIKIFGTLDASVPLLRKILSEVMLRRRKEDVLKDLPPISYADYYIEASELPVTVEYDKQKYLNEGRVLEEALSFALNDEQSALVLEGVANSVSTLRRINGLRKIRNYVDLITQELSDYAYEKIVIFAVHREVIEALKEELKQFNPVVINGGVSPKNRQDAIDSFQKDPECRVFIGQVIAAGTAITLTASHHVDVLEADWTPGNNAQAVMRCHRRGQRMPVFVRFIAIANSVDEKVMKVYRRKAQELTRIFDEGETNGTSN